MVSNFVFLVNCYIRIKNLRTTKNQFFLENILLRNCLIRLLYHELFTPRPNSNWTGPIQAGQALRSPAYPRVRSPSQGGHARPSKPGSEELGPPRSVLAQPKRACPTKRRAHPSPTKTSARREKASSARLMMSSSAAR